MKQKKPRRQLSSGLRLIVFSIIMGTTLVIFNWAGQWLDVEYDKEYWEITLTIIGFVVALGFITSYTIKNTDDHGLK